MTDGTQNNQNSGFTFGDQGGQGTPVPPPPPPAPAAQPVQPVYNQPTGTQPANPAAPFPPQPPAAPLAGMAQGAPAGGSPPPPPPPPPPIDPNYVFAKNMGTFTTTIKCPANELTFDEDRFLNLLAGSISLTKDEKRKIVESIPKLRQQQVDELIRIFDEERVKFIELSPKHGAQLEKLEKEHMADWRDIELELKALDQGKKEEDDADEIRKQLGL